MTIEEFKKRRELLNAEISKLIHDFEVESGCAVINIHIGESKTIWSTFGELVAVEVVL